MIGVTAEEGRAEGQNESFKWAFWHEYLDAEQFCSVNESRMVIEEWRGHYNHDPPHGPLSYQTPAIAYWGRAGKEGTATLIQP